jgi:hypothetical protein
MKNIDFEILWTDGKQVYMYVSKRNEIMPSFGCDDPLDADDIREIIGAKGFNLCAIGAIKDDDFGDYTVRRNEWDDDSSDYTDYTLEELRAMDDAKVEEFLTGADLGD